MRDGKEMTSRKATSEGSAEKKSSRGIELPIPTNEMRV
jgi:hypothetical protein